MSPAEKTPGPQKTKVWWKACDVWRASSFPLHRRNDETDIRVWPQCCTTTFGILDPSRARPTSYRWPGKLASGGLVVRVLAVVFSNIFFNKPIEVNHKAMTSQMELGFFSMIFWEMIQLQNESLSNSFPPKPVISVGPGWSRRHRSTSLVARWWRGLWRSLLGNFGYRCGAHWSVWLAALAGTPFLGGTVMGSWTQQSEV